MRRRGFLSGLLGLMAYPLVPDIPNHKPIVYWEGSRVPITEPMPLGHLQSVYYYRTAFDKHKAGVPRADAELMAREVCRKIFGCERIAWTLVPWDRYEETQRIQRG